MGLGTGQTFCLWMVILGILAILVGSAAPFWLTVEGPLNMNNGLWFYCSGTSSCSTYPWAELGLEDFTVWFYVTHALIGLATLLAITVLFLSLCSLCGEDESVTTPGVLAFFCGLLGIAGAVVFYLKSVESIMMLGTKRDWAFFVFACGAGAACLFSIILMILPKSRNSVQPC